MPRTYQTIRSVRRSGATTINLAKRRTWFADGDPAGDQQNKQGGSESKYNPQTVEDAMKIIAALEKRIGEREATIETQKSSIDKLNERITAIETANRKKLEEQGDFSALKTDLMAQIETLKPNAERAAALEKIIRESNEARIKAVPEQYRAMIPADYAPEKLQGWLNANEALLVKQPAPNFDAGAGAGSGGKGDVVKVTESDRRQAETAQAMGHKVTAEDIAKRRAGITTSASSDKKE